MRSEFEVAFNEITEMRALPRDVVLEALRTALISAYRRDSGASSAQAVDADIDPNTGRARIFVEKEVVDGVQNLNTEVDLEKARYYNPEAEMGDMVMVQVEGTTKKFGRIAAQTAKQVILQKIREAERSSLFAEYIEREGDLITGTVQSVNSNVVTLSLGRAEAILPRAQQIPGERYRPHDKVRTYVLEVKGGNRGPQIVVTRSHRNMLRRLLEYEVPEIYNGQVEIKNIAREAGYRSKVAVAALQEGIDPVGACVGMRGMRIQNIVKELHDEKIDVIEWNPDQEQFIAKSLSPARVSGVYLEEDLDSGRTAVVIVPDDQLSLAIGREGQNARLAAKLTGWRIDIKSVTEAVQEALTNINQPPLSVLLTQHTDLVEDVRRIMEKKEAGRTVMPEEYKVLDRFADLAENRFFAQREEARQARLAEINAVKSTLPQGAFTLPVADLGLSDEITEALAPLENVGEIMWRFLIDEGHLHDLLSDLPADSIVKLQASLDKVVIPEVLEAVAAGETIVEADEADEPVAEAEVEAVAAVDVAESAVAEEVASVAEQADEPEVIPAAFGDELPLDDERGEKKERRRKEPVGFVEEEEPIDALLDDQSDASTKKKKDRQRRRQLVFDEDAGEVVAKRRRKGGRVRDEWDDYLD